MSSSESEACEVDGMCVSKVQSKKKKKEEKKEVVDVSHHSIWENMRRKTVSLMKKTATYATATGNWLYFTLPYQVTAAN